MERGGRIEAFANLWPGAAQQGALDGPDALPAARRPTASMDALFASHPRVGPRAEGYRWFNLGMAPLAGLEESPVAPLWSRVGRFVYGHGENFYNFQGLRDLQGQVRSDLGAALSRLPGRTQSAADPGGHLRADRGRVPDGFSTR